MALFARKTKNASPDATENGTVSSGIAAPVEMPSPNRTFSAEEEDALAQVKAGRKGKKTARTARGLKGGAVVGLNIGNETIKAVELRGKGLDIAVTALGSIATPPDCLSNGVILNPVSLASALRDLFAQSGIKTRNVISSVSGSGALVVRVLEVPRMSDTELVENMNTDLERYIPFPPNEVVKDFRPLRELPSDPDSPNMEVLLAAAQNEVIDQHLQVLRDAKIEPQAIDVEPLAAARAIFFDASKNNGSEPFVDYNVATAVVNIGATNTEISVLRGDILVFTRSVPVGGHSMTQALADTLGLAWPDAEQLKIEMGDALPPHDDSKAAPNNQDWSEFGEPDDDAANAGASNNTDPFASDFFDQGPDATGRDPQTQHQQKQGGADGGEGSEKSGEKELPLPAFDLSRFNFSDDEAIVDEDIPTTPDDDLSSVPAIKAAPQTAAAVAAPSSEVAPPQTNSAINAQTTNASDDLANLPMMRSSSEETIAQDDEDTARLPGVLDFPMAGEDESLSGSAPSGQMYGMGSADDPDLISFPTLPVGLMAPGEEDVYDDDTDALPTLIDDDAPVESGVAVGADAFNTSATQDATQSATTPVDSVFDFSTPSDVTGSVDDFDTAFADMIGYTSPSVASPTVVAPGAAPALSAPSVAPSAFAMDATLAPEQSDFDLDQFATTGAASQDIGVDDFGFGLGDTGTITSAKVYEVLQPRLNELLGEVRRSLEYFSSRYPDAGVQRIVLVGGGARLANIDAMFTQEIGIPTTVDKPLSRLPMRVANLPDKFVDDQSAAFAVATGLALRDLVY